MEREQNEEDMVGLFNRLKEREARFHFKYSKSFAKRC